MSIPKTCLVDAKTTPSEAAAMLEHAPLVVKPNDSSLARGVTLGITTKRDLLAAIAVAGNYSKKVLIQQQRYGEELRFFVLDGKVTAVLYRQSPRVVGDGKHTLGQLIASENQQRAQLKFPYTIYPQLEEPVVPLGGLDMERVPAPDETVELRKTAMVRYGASIYNVREAVHETYIHAAEKLASVLGSGLVGVDMFIRDYRQPLTEDNYAFTEFNMSPMLTLFYCCRDGNTYDVLEDLGPMIDAALHQEACHG